jgi:pimeloyl-ACP methyl ester carboxylesterase
MAVILATTMACGLTSTFTVCGHSSGGSMASQHAVVFSDRVVGLGHFQAAPWGCSHLIDKKEEDYNDQCANSTASHAMAALAHSAFERGDIADPANLRQMPIFYYAGEVDSVVEPPTVEAAAGFYKLLSDRVVGLTVADAEHSFVTGTNCSVRPTRVPPHPCALPPSPPNGLSAGLPHAGLRCL